MKFLAAKFISVNSQYHIGLYPARNWGYDKLFRTNVFFTNKASRLVESVLTACNKIYEFQT